MRSNKEHYCTARNGKFVCVRVIVCEEGGLCVCVCVCVAPEAPVQTDIGRQIMHNDMNYHLNEMYNYHQIYLLSTYDLLMHNYYLIYLLSVQPYQRRVNRALNSV
jgi:hypothetical protein